MNVEQLEKNKVKISFEASAEQFAEGIKHSYEKNRGKLKLDGFRKGKAPRKMLEIAYGKDIFYNDAIDYVLNIAYAEALEESGLDIVSRPEIDVLEISEETGVKFTAEVYTKPVMTISNYKGITYKAEDKEVTEAELNDVINKERNKNARVNTITDRAVQEKDVVSIDFVGMVDGVPFPGGAGNNYELEIGSHTFIDNFEEQLVGKNIGDEVEVNVTFPQDYRATELAGKAALFKVTINGINSKELPELNDDFAQDVSEFETLEEYKKNLKESMQKQKEEHVDNANERKIMDGLIEKMEGEIPEVMFDNEAKNLMKDFERTLEARGLTVDVYTQFTGITKEVLAQSQKTVAEQNIKGRLALEAVAKAENLEASEEELEKELQTIAEAYKMEREVLGNVLGEKDLKAIKNDIKIKKAFALVRDNAVAIHE